MSKIFTDNSNEVHMHSCSIVHNNSGQIIEVMMLINKYLLHLNKRSASEIHSSGQLKIPCRGAANERLAPPLPAELAMVALLLNSQEGPSFGLADVT